MGINMNPILILYISITITLKSCFTLHYKAIKTEKQFVSFTSQIFILFWGLFSSMRRILSIICFFMPTFGVFSILYHHKAELPFSIWKKYNRTEKLSLYGLKESILWGELDRTDQLGNPPDYSIYTGLSLHWTFCVFFILSGMQFLVTLLAKILTSNKFARKEDFLDKFLHLVLGLNLAFPFEDWDQEKFGVKEYRQRHRETNIEMAWSLSINIVFSIVMMVPLWFTGFDISIIIFKIMRIETSIYPFQDTK